MSEIDYMGALDDVKPQVATLERLRELADDATLLDSEIAELTVKLTEKQEELVKITRKTIPDIMEELQMKSFKLQDGSELLVEDKVQASIPVANKAAAYKWLTDHGFDGIIKTNVSCQFSKGELEEAQKVVELLKKNDISATLDQSIHSSTLLSFIKERLAAAADEVENPTVVECDGFEADTEKAVSLPMDIFSVYEFKQAKIKAPKKKKK